MRDNNPYEVKHTQGPNSVAGSSASSARKMTILGLTVVHLVIAITGFIIFPTFTHAKAYVTTFVLPICLVIVFFGGMMCVRTNKYFSCLLFVLLNLAIGSVSAVVSALLVPT